MRRDAQQVRALTRKTRRPPLLSKVVPFLLQRCITSVRILRSAPSSSCRLLPTADLPLPLPLRASSFALDPEPRQDTKSRSAPCSAPFDSAWPSSLAYRAKTRRRRTWMWSSLEAAQHSSSISDRQPCRTGSGEKCQNVSA